MSFGSKSFTETVEEVASFVCSYETIMSYWYSNEHKNSHLLRLGNKEVVTQCVKCFTSNVAYRQLLTFKDPSPRVCFT